MISTDVRLARLLKHALLPRLNLHSQRNLWAWLNIVWNRVDEKRIKELGPDAACAEWLMRNGASVKWSDDSSFTTDYDVLQADTRKHTIREVDATDASITYMGFPYFGGCKQINRMRLHNCTYLDDQAMKNMSFLKDTLEHLQISSNGNITDTGVTSLGILSKLKTLALSDLAAVRNPDTCRQSLQTMLPGCSVEIKK